MDSEHPRKAPAGDPLRIAIVGSGPSGFYAAEALLRAVPACRIDMIERLPTPHGLVRYGVAPDHQKLKQVAAVFDTIAQDPRLTLYAGIRVGEHVSLQELRSHYHAVILATGSAAGRRLGVPGETLAGVHSSAEFVGWYNGHPEHVALQPGLTGSAALVIGNGNVSLDVCRMLVRPFDDLRASDIPESMLQTFKQRGVREVHMVGRGAATATKFTFKEFRQLADLPNVQIRVPQAAHWSDEDWNGAGTDDSLRVARWLHANARDSVQADGRIVVNFWFEAAPAAFCGDQRVGSVTFTGVNRAPGLPDALRCSLAVTCIGYEARPLEGVPHDPRTGTVLHRQGQVLDGHGAECAGLFIVGWAKRGPTGIIGTNRADGYETAQAVAERLPGLATQIRPDAPTLDTLLADRRISPLTYRQWLQVDRWERERGARLGKPREKVLSAVEVAEAVRDCATH